MVLGRYFSFILPFLHLSLFIASLFQFSTPISYNFSPTDTNYFFLNGSRPLFSHLFCSFSIFLFHRARLPVHHSNFFQFFSCSYQLSLSKWFSSFSFVSSLNPFLAQSVPHHSTFSTYQPIKESVLIKFDKIHSKNRFFKTLNVDYIRKRLLPYSHLIKL